MRIILADLCRYRQFVPISELTLVAAGVPYTPHRKVGHIRPLFHLLTFISSLYRTVKEHGKNPEYQTAFDQVSGFIGKVGDSEVESLEKTLDDEGILVEEEPGNAEARSVEYLPRRTSSGPRIVFRNWGMKSDSVGCLVSGLLTDHMIDVYEENGRLSSYWFGERVRW